MIRMHGFAACDCPKPPVSAPCHREIRVMLRFRVSSASIISCQFGSHRLSNANFAFVVIINIVIIIIAEAQLSRFPNEASPLCLFNAFARV